MEVREAAPGDWPAIWAIMEPVARAAETYCWDPAMDEDAGRAEWLPGPAGPYPTLRVFVALDDGGSVVGTAQHHANRGGPGSHVANASFLVSHDAGGKGVGRWLADFVLGEARSAGYTAMQFNAVVQTNQRAVRLWTSLGFDTVGTVPDAFLHPVTGPTGLHIMHRLL